MAYRYAVTRENHADLSAGAVLHSAPGLPAFPVRLTSEIFQRASRLRPAGPVAVWDPCCGSAYLLTVLAVLHRSEITAVLGTDIDPAALTLARRNLGLLRAGGFEARSADLRERAGRLDKPRYSATAAAAQRLAHRLAERGGPLAHSVAQADVFDPDQLRRALAGHRPDMVITDVPYGERTIWGGRDGSAGITGMLRSLDTVLDADAVIAVATRGRKVALADARRPLASFKIGTRTVAFFRPAR